MEAQARKELTTESLLAKSPSGVFRFWEGEAGRAVGERKAHTKSLNILTHKGNRQIWDEPEVLEVEVGLGLGLGTFFE